MTIAAFVDPGDQDRDLVLDLAIAIAEYSIAQHRTLYLLSDASTALEVGVALLGIRGSRAIEHGEYRTSPIKLLPFLDRSDGSGGEMEGPDENDVRDSIEELRRLGLFADRDDPETGADLTGDQTIVFNKIIQRAELIIGLGANSDLWNDVSDTRFSQKVVNIEGCAPDIIRGFAIATVRKDENARISIRSDSTLNDFDLNDAEFNAEDIRRTEEEVKREQDSGLLVAALLNFLQGSSFGERLDR